ncbi:MAG: VCBS repeat-containing protein [Acidobacteria bacterium]|nr:VCBS repeat-containing protein [Acidobacteriota bacterium]
MLLNVLCIVWLQAGPILSGPLVTRVDWSSHGMKVVDLDGDGRNDLVLGNNGRARIDLFYQKAETESPKEGWDPEIEDHQFQKKHLVVGQSILSLAVGDLNADGLPDLAFTGRPTALSIYYQTQARVFEKGPTFENYTVTPSSQTLICQDLNGDGRSDLANVFAGEVVVWFQAESGRLIAPRSYALSDDQIINLKAQDVNLDGLPDLVYEVGGEGHGLRVRIQSADHHFGAETAILLESLTGLSFFNTGDQPAMAWLQRKSGLLQLANVVTAQQSDWLIRSFPTAGSDHDPVFALGDLDANGLIDIALASAQKPEIHILFQHQAGQFSEREVFPSYSGIVSLCIGDLNEDGRPDLVAVSEQEHLVGFSSLDEKGKLTFPQSIPIEGSALATAWVPSQKGHGKLVLLQQKEKQRQVVSLTFKQGKWESQVFVLAQLQTNPQYLKVLDLDGNADLDLAIFTVQEPVRLLLADPKSGWLDLSQQKDFQKSFVFNLRAAALQPVLFEQKPAFLVSGEGFARLLTVGNGKLNVLDQYNSREARKQIGTAQFWSLQGEKPGELLMVLEDLGKIERLVSDESGRYESAESLEMDPIQLTDATLLDLDQNHEPDLLLWSRGQFLWVSRAKPDMAIERRGLYESPEEKAKMGLLAFGDLTGNGSPEAVLIDINETNRMEVLSLGDLDNPLQTLQFPIFEADPHFQGRRGRERNARQILIEDLTGDGRKDVVLLIHDRVLIYPQTTLSGSP